MNLYPYNTGHLMVVPYRHADDLGALEPDARAEMAELSASFCTGLKQVMGCDGMNLGMNLGSVAGAGISRMADWQNLIADVLPPVRGHEKVPAGGQLRSPLVATRSPRWWPAEVSAPH